MNELNESFLTAANSGKWTASPIAKGIVYKRGKPYLDFTYCGKRVRYNLDETLLQRCKRLGKPAAQGTDGKWVWPQDELDLLFAVICKLKTLKPRNPSPVTDSKVSSN